MPCGMWICRQVQKMRNWASKFQQSPPLGLFQNH
jgi:hypothetical protein